MNDCSEVPGQGPVGCEAASAVAIARQNGHGSCWTHDRVAILRLLTPSTARSQGDSVLGLLQLGFNSLPLTLAHLLCLPGRRDGGREGGWDLERSSTGSIETGGSSGI